MILILITGTDADGGVDGITDATNDVGTRVDSVAGTDIDYDTGKIRVLMLTLMLIHMVMRMVW